MRIREELRPEQERAAGLLQSLVAQMEVSGTGMFDCVRSNIRVIVVSWVCVALNSQVCMTCALFILF